MKKDSNPIDDLFRESLKGFQVEPPPASREGFLDAATRLGPRGGKGGFTLSNLLTVAGFLAAGLALVYILSYNDTKVADAPLPLSEKYSSMQVSGTSSLTNPVNNPTSQQHIPSGTNQKLVITQSNPQNNPSERTINETPAGRNTTLPAEPAQLPAQSSLPVAKANVAESSNDSFLPETKQPVYASTLPATPVKTIVPENPASTEKNVLLGDPVTQLPGSSTGTQADVLPPLGNQQEENKSGKHDPWLFEPFLLYHINWDLGNGFSDMPLHTLGLEGVIRKGRFFITAGAGWSLTKGYHQYDVDYNEYLGQYQRLDSMAFAYSEGSCCLVPTYTATTEVTVWDSLVQTENFRVKGRYNMLDVPLMLGYDVFRKGKFNLAIKSGIQMQIFIGSKAGTLDYNPGKDRVISLNPKDDLLARNNYWLVGDLSLSCLLTRKMVLEVEPMIKYHLNPSTTLSREGNELFVPAMKTSLKIKF